MRYACIQAEKAHYPVTVLCRVLQVARSGYYAWCQRAESRRRQQNQWALVHIRACHHASKGRYGSPRIYQSLLAQGIRIGRHRIARLMRQYGVQSHCRRRYRRATPSPAPTHIAANTLNRDFQADRPNQKWVGDITYLRVREGWLYLAVVLDLFSRRVVGWALTCQMTVALTLQAIDVAIQQRRVTTPVLAHSDQGSQYTAAAYQQRLVAWNIQGSMSRRGNCWDNAVAESFFATLKTELALEDRGVLLPQAEMRREIFAYLEGFYNTHRLHSTLDYVSPVEFERRWEAQQMALAVATEGEQGEPEGRTDK
jgi:transposase InsO family protein